jgi:hypothetical protein
MNTFLNITVITMIVGLIVERKNMQEQEAINAFYFSKIAEKLADSSTGLNLLSPYLLYELWNTEYVTGDYRNSSYMQTLI